MALFPKDPSIIVKEIFKNCARESARKSQDSNKSLKVRLFKLFKYLFGKFLLLHKYKIFEKLGALSILSAKSLNLIRVLVRALDNTSLLQI